MTGRKYFATKRITGYLAVVLILGTAGCAGRCGPLRCIIGECHPVWHRLANRGASCQYPDRGCIGYRDTVWNPWPEECYDCEQVIEYEVQDDNPFVPEAETVPTPAGHQGGQTSEGTSQPSEGPSQSSDAPGKLIIPPLGPDKDTGVSQPVETPVEMIPSLVDPQARVVRPIMRNGDGAFGPDRRVLPMGFCSDYGPAGRAAKPPLARPRTFPPILQVEPVPRGSESYGRLRRLPPL